MSERIVEKRRTSDKGISKCSRDNRLNLKLNQRRNFLCFKVLYHAFHISFEYFRCLWKKLYFWKDIVAADCYCSIKLGQPNYSFVAYPFISKAGHTNENIKGLIIGQLLFTCNRNLKSSLTIRLELQTSCLRSLNLKRLSSIQYSLYNMDQCVE